MNRAQEKLLTMLDEVTDVCKENGLTMFLFTNTALSAYNIGEFESSRYEINIAMLWRDAIAFQKAIEEKKPDDRLVESLFSNADFGNIAFRYVDKNSTYINKKSPVRAKELGLAINIWPLLSRECEKVKKRTRKSGLKALLRKIKYEAVYRAEANQKQKIVDKMMECINMLREGKSLGPALRDQLLECMNELQKDATLDDTLYFRRFTTVNRTAFPKGLFSNLMDLEFEGRTYQIPEDVDTFFTKQFSKYWMNRKMRGTDDVIMRLVLLDEDLPYSKYLDYLKDQGLEDYIDKPMYFPAVEEHKQCNKVIDDSWRIVLRTAARINMWDQYMPLKQQIKDLYAQDKWEELEEILEDYDAVMTRMIRIDLPVYFDREIFNIYCEILERRGEENVRERLLELVPEEHLEPIVIG
ncbi:MAG: LicD family protein [Firmicutes bacterium]|nr:LicD family protein [Bacillota bacterium]